MTATAHCEASLIFVPNPAQYDQARHKSEERARFLLEFLDEMLLRKAGGTGHSGDLGVLPIDVLDGRLSELSIEALVAPPVATYSTDWNAWKTAGGAPPEDLGTIQLVSGGAQSGVYYYERGGQQWCLNDLSLELAKANGDREPFQLSRTFSDGTVLIADVMVSLKHAPIQVGTPVGGGV